MPITVYGDIPAKATLPQDADLPKPRTILVRMLSKNETRAFRRRVDAAMVITDEDARYAEYDKLLGEVVTGWENIPGDFSVAAISDHFTLPEVIHLLRYSIHNSMFLGADDLKKSASSSPSPTV